VIRPVPSTVQENRLSCAGRILLPLNKPLERAASRIWPASNFANLAADLLLAGKAGHLVAIRGGRYGTEPIEMVGEGTKRVDVEKFYDTEQYRANITGVMGLPMFLCQFRPRKHPPPR
jgi:hypothetical protein